MIRMHLPLTNRPSHSDQEHLDLSFTPAQHARKPRQTESLDPVQHVDLAPAADLLQPLVFRPWV